MFGPARYLGFDAVFIEPLLDHFAVGFNSIFLFFAARSKHSQQSGVLLGLHGPESEIFKFPFDSEYSQPSGKRGIDFQDLGSDPLDLLTFLKINGSHVVELIRQLDQDDPNILCRGQ